MATFTDSKTGKKSFSMNPQMGKMMHSPIAKVKPEVDATKPMNDVREAYDGHEHEGQKLAHHVEIHHGGHPGGEPPMQESHTHHVIAHPHHESTGGMEAEHNLSHDHENAQITNHDNYDSADQHARNAMHADCPECAEGGENMGNEEEAENSGDEDPAGDTGDV